MSQCYHLRNNSVNYVYFYYELLFFIEYCNNNSKIDKLYERKNLNHTRN